MTPVRLTGLLAFAVACGSASAAEVVIYRCTDAQGRLALRDSPCRAGERQQVRSMQRPTDPPPRPAAVARPPSPAPAPERTRIVVVTPPRPLYECLTPDGNRYTSESDTGRPRWEPLWAVGVAPWAGGHPGSVQYRRHRGPHLRIEGRIGDGNRYALHAGRSPQGGLEPPLRPPLHPPPDPGRPPVHRPPVYGPPLAAVAVPAGAWVRDACHPLPQAEVCARLRDERYALDRRYHSALQSERVRITTEQRGIDARLASDCGGS